MGSLSIIYPWKILRKELILGHEKVVETTRYLPEIDNQFFIAIALMIVGAVLVATLEYFGNKEMR